MFPPSKEGSVALQGAALTTYRSPPSECCWWCGGRGLTREHKFKKSDLSRMWDGEGLVWGDGESLRDVRSPRKSKVVRFRANLCARCNNERSQPFDYAYDAFSNFVWANQDRLWRRRYFDMADVYGDDWSTGTLNLARYLAKHIACRMVHDGFTAPPTIGTFLNGGQSPLNVQMVLFKDRDLYGLYRRGVRDGCDARGLWIAPAQGAVSRARERLTMYSSSLTIGAVGVMYRWDEDCDEVDPFYVYRRARLHKRHRLPA